MIQVADLSWQPIPTLIEERVLAVYDSWIGTQYMSGQRAKGIAVDCIQPVGGVMDELFGRSTPAHIPRLPVRFGLGSSQTGIRTSLAIRKQFPSEVTRDGRIEPGDVIVTRGTLGPGDERQMGHVLLAGVRPWSFLHAEINTGVAWTGIKALPTIVRMYRVKDKDKWVSSEY